MNANTNKIDAKQTAMNLDLALGNGGKANKALRSTASTLIQVAFNGGANADLLAEAALINTKSTSAEIVSLFQTLVSALR